LPLTLPTRLARLVLVFAGFLTALVLAGCAQMPRATAQDGLKNEFWTGRISLQVQSEPVQSFSASFELRGGPERGELSLTSPLGNVLGVLRWAPGIGSEDAANSRAERLLDSGEAKLAFDRIIDAQGRREPAAVPGALTAEVAARHSGVVGAINGWRIAEIARTTGAPWDFGGGLELRARRGDTVRAGDALYTIRSNSPKGIEAAAAAAASDDGYEIA